MDFLRRAFADFSRIACAAIIVGLLPCAFVGCPNRQAQVQSDSADRDPESREAAGRKLLREVLAAYAQATAYHDEARIVVRYRLNGSPMEEHQLWAVDFQRPNQLAARLFNARIQSDQQRTTAMVFDFDSQNMDNQYLVLQSPNGPPWEEMFQDPVCRHFISGSSEIPFNSRLPGEWNLPPTIGLLLGQPAVPWLLQPDRVELLADDAAVSQSPRRIRVEHDRRQYELWIDPQRPIITQLTLPNQFLDDALLIAPEITDVRLTVQFAEATFEPKWTAAPFSTELPESANPVSRFVPLPESFPSECIGKPLVPLSVTAESGLVTTWSPSAATTVLAWVDRQDSSRELIRKLESLAESSTDKPLRVQLFFVEFPDPNPQIQKPIELPQFIRAADIQLPIVSDVGLTSGEKLGVKFAPTALVLDASGVVQFFRELATGSGQSELAAAIVRVQNGDNLASEMRAEYAKFIDDYQSKLRKLNPLADNTPSIAKPVAHQSATTPRPPDAPFWQFSDAKLPGNILRVASDRLLINDGWQTVLELDPQTQAATRHPLQLEADLSVTILRAFGGAQGKRVMAFSEMGRQVLWLDSDWQTVGSRTFPAESQIRDVQLADHDRDGTPEIWLLDVHNRLSRFDDSLTNELEHASLESAESFIAIDPVDAPGGESSGGAPATVPDFLVVRTDGGLQPLSRDLQAQAPIAFGQLKIRRLIATPFSGLLACAVALDERGQWQAVGINRKMEVAWMHPIGPQEFDRQIQPIATLAQDSTSALIAFAASDDTVTVISADGQLCDFLQWPASIQGLTLLPHDGSPLLVVSDAARVCATPVAAVPGKSKVP